METSKGKILIVDDNPTNIQVVGNILTEKGFDIAFAQSGEKAIEQVLHTDYDLILLDIMMPEKDGFEICEILKANPQTNDIPIIYLTAKSDIDSIIRGLRNGGIDYISKPFIKEELIVRVENQIKMSNKMRHLLTESLYSEAVKHVSNECVKNRRVDVVPYHICIIILE